MAFVHSIGSTRYSFASLRELLAKATPLRSGDVLAGLAAGSAEERVAAQFALADVPLAHFLTKQVVPYEDDEVTRLIVDTHDADCVCAGAVADGGRAARLAALRRGDAGAAVGAGSGTYAGDGGGGEQADAGAGPDCRGARRFAW